MDADTPLVRDLREDERDEVGRRIAAEWGLPIVSVNEIYQHLEHLPGVVAEVGGRSAGVALYNSSAEAWEIVVIYATQRRTGAGRAMMESIRDRARAAAASRLWLITTDDNAGAVSFYDALGMRRARIHDHFIERVRAHKPDLPHDVFRDAIEFEWDLR